MSGPSAESLFPAGDPASPPRRNGELLFQAPWESRLFGVTISLHRAGSFEWDEFRSLLIDEIGSWERQGRDDSEWSYYEHWRRALERLLATRGLCAPEQLDTRTRELKQRPAGHDH